MILQEPVKMVLTLHNKVAACKGKEKNVKHHIPTSFENGIEDE
jgi:hypothetical protein